MWRVSTQIVGSRSRPVLRAATATKVPLQPDARYAHAALGEECDQSLALALHLGFADNLSGHIDHAHAAAYTNNDLNPDTNTTLFDIDTTLDQVSVQSPPNNGSLAATGLLTVDADAPVGFDNYTRLRKDVAVANNAFATLVVDGKTGFYRVDLLTGTASLIGHFSGARHDFRDPVVDIAVPLKQ